MRGRTGCAGAPFAKSSGQPGRPLHVQAGRPPGRDGGARRRSALTWLRDRQPRCVPHVHRRTQRRRPGPVHADQGGHLRAADGAAALLRDVRLCGADRRPARPRRPCQQRRADRVARGGLVEVAHLRLGRAGLGHAHRAGRAARRDARPARRTQGAGAALAAKSNDVALGQGRHRCGRATART